MAVENHDVKYEFWTVSEIGDNERRKSYRGTVKRVSSVRQITLLRIVQYVYHIVVDGH